MTRALADLLGIGVSEDDRRRARLERVAQYHAQAAADFAEVGDEASASANLKLATETVAACLAPLPPTKKEP